MAPGLDGWGSTQRHDEAGSIDSEQNVRAPYPVVARSEEGARLLGRHYWLEITRASHGLIRFRDEAQGVELRLLRRGPLLLRFGAAEISVEDDRIVCRYPIRGGLLARRQGGTLTLSQIGRDRPELRSAVSGFFPRLGLRPGFPRWSGALYELVQGRVHVAISRRYFARLLAEVRR